MSDKGLQFAIKISQRHSRTSWRFLVYFVDNNKVIIVKQTRTDKTYMYMMLCVINQDYGAHIYQIVARKCHRLQI